MSGFSLEWLRRREPYDVAARDRELARGFAATLARSSRSPVRVLDLASGTGASFRALAPVVGIDQHWLLADNDIGLAAAQAEETAHWARTAGWSTSIEQVDTGTCVEVRAGTRSWVAEACVVDVQDLDALAFEQFDAVTTSAFLDLVPAPWLDGFARRLAYARRPLLAMLSVDGRRDWQPNRHGDDAIGQAFEQHQARDKGMGAALGPAAAQRLAGLLQAAGMTTKLVRADWQIGPAATDMLGSLLDETLHAASATRADCRPSFERWHAHRRAQLSQGLLSLTVGHLDLLALPAAEGDSSA
jgi:hypothetical protein